MGEEAVATRSNAPGAARNLTDLLDPAFCARLDGLDIFSRKILQGKLQGERRTKLRGQSVEFADHRQYAVGDDLRFLDWHIYARLGQLFVKMFLEEQDLTVDIALDVSGSMQAGSGPAGPADPKDPERKTQSKLRAGQRLAAALGYIGLVNNNRVTLTALADGLVAQAAGLRGRSNLPRLAEFLLTLPQQEKSDFEKSCRQLALGRVGTGVTVLISDFLFKEGYEAALRRLISARSDLYVIQMLSPDELDPPLAGDLKLIDVEDGDQAEVSINEALMKYYKRTLSAYCNQLKDFCTKRGVAYTLTHSAEPVETLILQYLRRRGLVR
jgi:uncharacterized protein (DUF58 family)